ncbi:ClpP/crotonase-like domain-containing protein [Roridomyces roridus]|uniref:ClpP/crotonase-like domain-containing protein n=1 Tax=Roridomyces roridus TaxID=1738132 RepID=A0AAD7FQH3_9AGAR|nr:ClpP/crotonase-like domain-containing protein [Roridomyces roridus]
MSESASTVEVAVADGIATITLRRPAKLNAITVEGKEICDYTAFANALRDLDKRDDVLVTVWQGISYFFGTDVRSAGTNREQTDELRANFLNRTAPTTTDCGHALYNHSKILVCALNGPVMGIAAAFLGYFDFIYCMDNAWLCVPFTFLGIVAEGGASVSFVNRMGVAKANEVLIWGRKKEAQELYDCGFVNKIFPQQSVESFHAAVRKLLLEELRGLDPSAVLVVKKLIKTGLHEKNNPDGVNLRESYAQAERFASGIPAIQFMRIANKEIKHKL